MRNYLNVIKMPSLLACLQLWVFNWLICFSLLRLQSLIRVKYIALTPYPSLVKQMMICTGWITSDDLNKLMCVWSEFKLKYIFVRFWKYTCQAHKVHKILNSWLQELSVSPIKASMQSCSLGSWYMIRYWLLSRKMTESLCRELLTPLTMLTTTLYIEMSSTIAEGKMGTS